MVLSILLSQCSETPRRMALLDMPMHDFEGERSGRLVVSDSHCPDYPWNNDSTAFMALELYTA